MGTYEVGYKKPPKQWQFQKGQSGNPLGRKAFKPCEEHRLSSALAAELDQPVSVRRNGKLGKLTNVDDIPFKIFVLRLDHRDDIQKKLLLPGRELVTCLR